MTYTTGGLERFHWLARYFNTGTQNVNVLFAYDGHNPTIDLLRPGEIVDYTTYSDLLMSQVNKDLFVYPATLEKCHPDRSWAKLKLAGHDWKQASRIYELNNHKYMFDMGHGVSFTTSPLFLEHESLSPRDLGTPILVEELASPASFFHPFQHFKITAALNETDNTIELTIPDDAPKTEWQMLASNTFALQPQQLYYMSTFVQDIDLTQVSLEFSIGFYTAGGNRLDTAYAIMENTLPSPPPFSFRTPS